MKDQKILKLNIESMAFGGEAIATHEGLKIFVPWAVPGDCVNAEIVEQKKDYARARIVDLLEASPHRISPPCVYFRQCGGCQWQHIHYDAQLAFKQSLLLSALQRTAKIQNPVLLPPIQAPQAFHYRSKIRLQVSPEGKLGFYKLHSKNVVEIESCAIAQDELNAKISEAKQLSRQLLSKGDTRSHEIEIFKGEKKVRLSIDGEESVFAQANQAQNEVLKAKALEYLALSGGEKVLELFAGDGNFTFFISPHVAEVVAVESNSLAVQRGEAKMQRAHARNIEWAESSLHRYLASAGKSQKFDRVLLDPPRMGLAEGLEALAALRIPRMVYVSCDPATLARDLKALIEKGYAHEFSQVIDMFPQTYHIESIHVLTFVGN